MEIDDLYKLFRPFGKINRIMVYCRNVILKAFIEFRSSSSVKVAMENVNSFRFNDFGVVKVFQSDKGRLRLDNKYVEFKDYSKNLSNNTTSLKKYALNVKRKKTFNSFNLS